MNTISKRLNLTIENIKLQKNSVLWDDLEKLEEVLGRVKEVEKENEILKARILNLKYGIESWWAIVIILILINIF